MHTEQNFLCRLLATGAEKGDLSGACVWCGQNTTKGLPINFSNNFTGYSWLVAGNCLCPWCHEVFTRPELRRSSWLATAAGATSLTRDKVRDLLLEPPDPPWYLYIAKAGKKQSWLSAARAINRSRETYRLSAEWQDMPINTTRQEVGDLFVLAEQLRQAKVSKSELISGQMRMTTWQRAIDAGQQHLLRQAQAQARRPIWEVVVYVAQ